MDKTIRDTFVMSSENIGEEELILPSDQRGLVRVMRESGTQSPAE